MTRKTFTISPTLDRGLTETIDIVENNQDLYRNAVIPTSKIELDPKNPRKMVITLNDVVTGLKPDDPDYKAKNEELDKLLELSESIKISGIINPITVFKYSENYRIIAGERRYLASLLANKTEIEARIFNKRPGVFELKLIQWFENTERENLSLVEKLENLNDIVNAYKAQNPSDAFTIEIFSQITGLSYTQSGYYMALLDAEPELMQAIKCKAINNLQRAVTIASCKDKRIRSEALKLCFKGASLPEVKKFIAGKKFAKENKTEKKGRPLSYVTMGNTANLRVVRILIESVLNNAVYSKFSHKFTDVDWNKIDTVNFAFKELIKLIEDER